MQSMDENGYFEPVNQGESNESSNSGLDFDDNQYESDPLVQESFENYGSPQQQVLPHQQQQQQLNESKDESERSQGFEEFLGQNEKTIDRDFSKEQRRIEREVRKLKPSYVSGWYEKYNYLWDLRKQVDPNHAKLNMPTNTTNPTNTTSTETDPIDDLVNGPHGAPLFAESIPGPHLSDREEQDLKQQEQQTVFLPDCPEILGEPVVVVTIFVLGLLIFAWGCWSAGQYAMGYTKDMGQIWRQTAVSMMFLTVMSLVLPARLRFSWTLYGALTVMLFAQYAFLVTLYPFILPTSEELEVFRSAVQKGKAAKIKT